MGDLTAPGTRLPAVPKQSLYAGLAWRPVEALTLTVEGIGRSRMFADDRNLAEVAGYGAFNVRADWTNDFRWGRLSQTLRVDNLADHRYVGSVIVNESNGRYYEPSPGRTALYLLSVALR